MPETFFEYFCREGREKFDVILFDIDGTLSVGARPMPGAEKLLTFLNEEKFPYLLVTNDCYSSHEEKSANLRKGNLPVQPENIFSCGDVLKIWQQKSRHPGKLFYLCGRLGNPCYADFCGIRTISDPACIDQCDGVIFGEGSYTWECHLNAVFNFFLKHPEAPFLVGNPDSYWISPQGKGMSLGAGSQARFVHSVLQEAGRKTGITYLGKPHPLVYEGIKLELQERFQREISPEKIAMVGDSLASDIRGAKAQGWFAGLVLSGITTPELAAAAPADRIPDRIFSGV